MDVRRQLPQVFADDDFLFSLPGLPFGPPLLLEVLLVRFGEMLGEISTSLSCFQEDIRFSFPYCLLGKVGLVFCVGPEDQLFLGLEEVLWEDIPYYTGKTTRGLWHWRIGGELGRVIAVLVAEIGKPMLMGVEFSAVAGSLES
jgi:hypothetical protein